MIDKTFLPAYKQLEQVNKNGTQAISFAVLRGEMVLRYDMKISGRQDYFVCERVIKSMLWVLGGARVMCDDSDFCEYLKQIYNIGGAREFDYSFMGGVFGAPFTIEYVATNSIPNSSASGKAATTTQKGCRVGIDMGGSELKVCATFDGEPVHFYSEAWQPKTNTDPLFYGEKMLLAILDAATHLPRLDSVGVSTAGVVVGKRIKISSLFLSLSKEDNKIAEGVIEWLEEKLNVPVTVVNDGDAAAIMGGNDMLAISMGTSQAGGYIDRDGRLRGYIAELAFVPIDFYKDAALDEWSGDRGCGVKYFSQDGVIKLAESLGYVLEGNPSQKIKSMFKQAQKHELYSIYDTIGEYLGYSLPYYAQFMSFSRVRLLGGVTGGEWGERIAAAANAKLKELGFNYIIELPEINRNLGQSLAASLLLSE